MAGPLDLSPALPVYLVEVAVLPGVGRSAGKAAVSVKQRGGLGDRCPAVVVELGVEGEFDPYRRVGEAPRSVSGPRTGHHEAGCGGHPDVQALGDGCVGRVGLPQVIAGDDDLSAVRRAAQALQ